MSIIQANKFTTLNASGIAAGATSATLSSAAFTNGKKVPLVLDNGTAAKLEVILADITGTALTNIVRGQDGTSDVAHTGCSVTIGAVPSAIEYYLTENGGWLPAFETWAYASATTITVPAGAAAKYSVGDKIKLTQTTVKYFYVTAVADTVLTVTGGSDYTVANAAITANYYSKASSPVGFPQWFAYTPVWTQTSTNPTLSNGTLIGKFSLSGRSVLVHTELNIGSSTSLGTGDFRISLPITPVSTSDIGFAYTLDAGTRNYFASAVITGATVYFSADNSTAAYSQTVPMTWASGDLLKLKINYEI